MYRAIQTAVFLIAALLFVSCDSSPNAESESGGSQIDNQIAFEMYTKDSKEIYVVDSDGSNSKRLTDNGTYEGDPIISPDGTEIAFLSDRNSSDGQAVDLFVMNADGSNVREVTELSTFSGRMDWSADGEKLVYSDLSNDNADIYVVNVDGSGKTRLTDDPEFRDYHPSWSPDGSQIVFDRYGGGDYLDYDLYTMDSNGGNLQRLTDDDYANEKPRWSPDGSKVAFTRDREDSRDRVYTIDVDSRDITQVTGFDDSNDSGDDWPTWSPDGSEIAYESVSHDGDGTGVEVYRVNADGSGSHEVVTSSFDNDADRPFWSPVE